MDKAKQTEAINLMTLVALRTAELAEAADRIRDEADKLAKRAAAYLESVEV